MFNPIQTIFLYLLQQPLFVYAVLFLSVRDYKMQRKFLLITIVCYELIRFIVFNQVWFAWLFRIA